MFVLTQRARAVGVGLGLCAQLWGSAAVAAQRSHGSWLEGMPRGPLGGGAVIRGSRTDSRWRVRGGAWVDLGSERGLWRLPSAAWAEPEVARGRGLCWAPPRRMQLDELGPQIELPGLSRGQSTGQGVVVGVVDSGVDWTHPDLQDRQGRTRVAWWLDFSQPPAGLHPELEARFGCVAEEGLWCRVYSGADLETRAQAGETVPADPQGHGTHIASIALGNGRSRSDGRYAGVAPEAELVVASVTNPRGSITDADVILATRFVFERAEAMGMPAVVNLSLGGDFGPHDGSDELSLALAEQVGPEHPGRSIVVATGNSGSMLRGVTHRSFEPLGLHAELDIDGRAELPVLVPHGGEVTDATLLFWLTLYPAPGSPVLPRIGLSGPEELRAPPVGRGGVSEAVDAAGELIALVVNGPPSDPRDDDLAALFGSRPATGASAVVLIDGPWRTRSPIQLLFEGRGRVEAWIQSEGDLGPGSGAIGARFPNATERQTVTIPATHPSLIAVGASLNRLSWPTRSGMRAEILLDAASDQAVGVAARFSSGGPNALGHIKPDLMAPGAFVAGALSSSADPETAPMSIFDGSLCGFRSQCQVVSDRYAVTRGSSMAAPAVSGAVALLLARDPGLTQPEILSLLQTGAEPREPAGARQGAGLLSVRRALEAQARVGGSAALSEVSVERSHLTLARSVLLPDPSRSASGLIRLRDRSNTPLDIPLRALELQVFGGRLTAGLSRSGVGLYRFAVAANSDAGELQLQLVTGIGQILLQRRLPVRWQEGAPSSPARDSGCSLGPRSRHSPRSPWALWALGLSIVSRCGVARRRVASAAVVAALQARRALRHCPVRPLRTRKSASG